MRDPQQSTQRPPSAPAAGPGVRKTHQLRATLRASDVEATRRELRDALAAVEQPVAIDLSAVTTIDVMSLQLLLSARASARAEGCVLAFVAASPAVLELCDAVGLAPTLLVEAD
jgi:anti-anti-sigma regulatory factor